MMTRDEFVALVRDAYARTGLQPMRDVFRSEMNGRQYACAIGALVSARGECPASEIDDWITAAQKCVDEPYDFYDGVINGFDECFDAGFDDSPDYQRGFECGRAIAQEMFGTDTGARETPATPAAAEATPTDDTAVVVTLAT